MEETARFGLWRPSWGFDNLLAKRVLYIPKPRGDIEMFVMKFVSFPMFVQTCSERPT
jgi:hypothetical protein